MKHKNILSQMTLEEKALMCSGEDFWHFKGCERLNIRGIAVSDGPHGLRDQTGGKADHLGVNESAPATCFPAAATLACSWDEKLVEDMARAIAVEAKTAGISIVLGPGINMKRSPLCGRNFEYFSEDPFLTGKLSTAYVNAMQGEGVGTSLKHFAANSQENKRLTISAEIDERTLREIYLSAFEMTVKEAQPWTVMNAYNRLNGEYCGESKWLLTDVLKNEWGHTGLVETDWGAEDNIVAGIRAGQHIEMPASNGMGPRKIIEAVQNSELDEEVLDARVNDILDVLERANNILSNGKTYAFDENEHHSLARKIASESMVLLKNDNNILPLDDTKTYALIGDMAEMPRYQGSGSSKINPTKIENPLEELRSAGIKFHYAKGYERKSDFSDKMLEGEAIALAKRSDAVILFAGLTESYEAEGFDRHHLRMPKSHIDLISKLSRVNSNIIVVLASGSPIEMPWLRQTKAVLHSYLGGQASGGAVADILTGKTNPSGKLAETYPLRLEDNPSNNYFPGGTKSVAHREGIYIGYRYYDTVDMDVLFPFGFGLSYTEFAYSDLKITPKIVNTDADFDKINVSLTIKNTGKTDGAEICQLYVKDTHHTVYRPEKELKGFAKVFLKAGDEKTVTIALDKRAFSYFSTELSAWHVENGDFDILVGASSRDIRLRGTVPVTLKDNFALKLNDGKRLPTYMSGNISRVSDNEFLTLLGRDTLPEMNFPAGHKFDRNSSFEDARYTKWGARFYNILFPIITKLAGSFEENPEMIAQTGMQMPLRSFVTQSQGIFSEYMMNNLILLLNDEGNGKNFAKIVVAFIKALPELPELLSQM